MSTAMRRTLNDALLLSEAFRALFPPHCLERWEYAGSLRRRKPDVGDIDVVALPCFADIAGEDMFATPARTNLLWRRVDDLLGLSTFKKHIKDTLAGPRTKWGELCRAIEFRGCCFEINLADADNFGPLLAIKTGPAELSEALVTRIKRYGYACRDGFHVWDTKASPPYLIAAVTEEQFFKQAGLAYLPPAQRQPPND